MSILSQRRDYNTGAFGMNLGQNEENRRKLAEERKQEYNRMLAEKANKNRRHSIAEIHGRGGFSRPVTSRTSGMGSMPRRPPSSLTAGLNNLGSRASIQTVDYNNLLSQRRDEERLYRQMDPLPAAASDLNFEKENLEGALNQLNNFMNGVDTTTTINGLNFAAPVPRYSSNENFSFDTVPPIQQTTYQQPPPTASSLIPSQRRRRSLSALERNRSSALPSGVQPEVHSNKITQQEQYRLELQQQIMEQKRNKQNSRIQDSRSYGNTTSYQPSLFEDNTRRRGEFNAESQNGANNPQAYKTLLEQQIMEKQVRDQKEIEGRIRFEMKKDREIEEYNPWGKGGAGAPNIDASGNVISSRTYRPVGSNIVTEKVDYKDDLKKQIEDNKRRAKEVEMKKREEDERLAKRAQEQSERMKKEYEDERARQKRKEEELQQKQDMMRKLQEDQLKEEKRKKQEKEEKKKEEHLRKEEESRQAERASDLRSNSPVIPTLQSKVQENHRKPKPPPPESPPRRKRQEPKREQNNEQSSDGQQDALDTLSTVRKHLQAKQLELQKDLEVQKRRYQVIDRNVSDSGGFSDSDEDPGDERSTLNTARRIRGSISNNGAGNDVIVGRSNRARMRRLQRLQKETEALDRYKTSGEFINNFLSKK
ncbi:Uncharacterised protein at_DN1575 [Pycnogonum litorale]